MVLLVWFVRLVELACGGEAGIGRIIGQAGLVPVVMDLTVDRAPTPETNAMLGPWTDIGHLGVVDVGKVWSLTAEGVAIVDESDFLYASCLDQSPHGCSIGN